MKKEKKKICARCGEIIRGESVEISCGEYVCQDCFDEYYFICEDCGKIEDRDNGYWIKDSEILVCEDCVNNNYYRCEDCGDYFRNTTYIESYGEVCERCLDNYGYCEGCDCWYS